MSQATSVLRRSVTFSALVMLLWGALSLAGCGREVDGLEPVTAPVGGEADDGTLSLPTLEPIELDGGSLHIVATTDVISNVVGEVGGDRIDLITLMAPGQDPHSYTPSTADLAAVAEADAIFVNGWGLEEGLLETVEQTAEHGPLIAISAGVTPLSMYDDSEGEHEHGSIDPHVWLDPHNVIQWTGNAATVLGALDPAHAETYRTNAETYVAQLEDLIEDIESQIAQIPPEQRKLVVTHDSLRYFARRFGFDVVGAVITGSSTLAEPSAGELAELIAAMEEARVCTIFVESTVNHRLAETVAGELSGCDEVHIVELYTGSLGPKGSSADNYIGMMRANMDAVARGLTGQQ